MESQTINQAARLPQPVRIRDQEWPDKTTPLVSVFCITYNHVKFIRDAIDGFLMQETTFPVEIFVHDDASIDGTAEIVGEYAEQYPHLFWTIIQKENQWSQFTSHQVWFPQKILGPMSYLSQQRGEFIALCEGDDYWTDPLKLEKQVQFLCKNETYSGVFHRCLVVDENGDNIPHYWNDVDYQTCYTQKECLLDLRSAYPTASLVFRTACVRNGVFPHYYRSSPCDHTLDVLITKSGNLAFMNFMGSAYRKHDGGVWWSSNPVKQHQMLAQRFLAFLSDYEFRRLYSRELRNALFQNYSFIWWQFYKEGITHWLRAYFTMLFLFSGIAHFFLFVKYSTSKHSVVRYTLLDSVKKSVQNLLSLARRLWHLPQ